MAKTVEALKTIQAQATAGILEEAICRLFPKGMPKGSPETRFDFERHSIALNRFEDRMANCQGADTDSLILRYIKKHRSEFRLTRAGRWRLQ